MNTTHTVWIRNGSRAVEIRTCDGHVRAEIYTGVTMSDPAQCRAKVPGLVWEGDAKAGARKWAFEWVERR
jgi:hypothetical protein